MKLKITPKYIAQYYSDYRPGMGSNVRHGPAWVYFNRADYLDWCSRRADRQLPPDGVFTSGNGVPCTYWDEYRWSVYPSPERVRYV